MRLEIYQIIIMIFAVFALSRVILQKKSKNFSFNEFIFWSGIWVALILVSFSNPFLSANFLKSAGVFPVFALILSRYA